MELIPKVVQAVAGYCVIWISSASGWQSDTVAWDMDGNRNVCTCVDLDPCEIYESCPVASDPLKDVI